MRILKQNFDAREEKREKGLIPERVQRLFWDTLKSGVDPWAHRSYIIRRIMDYGDLDDVRWMLNTYSSEVIKPVLEKGRGLSRKSGTFWGNHFHVPKEKIACLQTPYRKKPAPF